MHVFLDTSHDFALCERELNAPVGQLVTPTSWRSLRDPDRLWAIDNGAFSEFDEKTFLSVLNRHIDPDRRNCKFVAVPDVVGSARRTLEVFEFWWDRLTEDWPIALVAQDGQEALPIPWTQLAAIFIGGTDAFKLSPGAAHIIKAAKILGKWVHVGRVNTPSRFRYFEELGVDSIDGAGIAQYSHMRLAIGGRANQECLNFSEAPLS